MLKYLFQATYKDGSHYLQNPEDTSVTRPEHECKSSFTDVRVDDVKVFFISNEEHTYSVNLEDGHFEIDGLPFYQHEDEHLHDFKLIYKRNVKHSQDFKMTLGNKIAEEGENKTFEVAQQEAVGEPNIVRSYIIGWEAHDPIKKQSVTKIIQVY